LNLMRFVEETLVFKKDQDRIAADRAANWRPFITPRRSQSSITAPPHPGSAGLQGGQELPRHVLVTGLESCSWLPEPPERMNYAEAQVILEADQAAKELVSKLERESRPLNTLLNEAFNLSTKQTQVSCTTPSNLPLCSFSPPSTRVAVASPQLCKEAEMAVETDTTVELNTPASNYATPSNVPFSSFSEPHANSPAPLPQDAHPTENSVFLSWLQQMEQSSFYPLSL
jgi:hypothetical protein